MLVDVAIQMGNSPPHAQHHHQFENRKNAHGHDPKNAIKRFSNSLCTE